MKNIKGIIIGGLQQKIFNLVLFFILALVGLYAAVSVYQQKNLADIVQRTGAEQQSSIETISEETMKAVLDAAMARTTALQAYIADDLFADVQTDVRTLQAFAAELFAHEDSFSPRAVFPPDPDNAGKASIQMLHEALVDPADSASLGLLGNMGEVMLAMFENTDKLNSCFAATADGCILYVDDRADEYISADGTIWPFEVRTRPWYRQAAEAGELIFTGVELDAFSGFAGLVCAAPVYRNGELAAVVGADIFLTSISDYVNDTATDGGFVCVIDQNGRVLFSPAREGVFKAELSNRGADLRESENAALASFTEQALRERTGLELIEVDGKAYYLTGAPMETLGWAVVSVMDKELTDLPAKAMLASYEEINGRAFTEFEQGARRSGQTVLIMTLTIFALALACSLLLASRAVKPLEIMTRRVRSLGGDDLRFDMEDAYRTGDEIELLAESFAMLSGKTVQYIEEVERITAEKERIGTELALATRIQADMLPNIFPAFPERSEFDVYASMDPAKEVGGDFYDFFLIDDDHLCLVMADVSGKGVPAALFMMAAKILLANNAMAGKSPAQILNDANAAICANNREEMFVTVWLGILEISTGKLIASNAGHEYPALKRAGGEYELFRDKHGLVVGAMDIARYRDYELQLEPGDSLFVYTDGVPEATAADGSMLGTDRMLAALNAEPENAPEQCLAAVRRAVDGFVQGAEQFDDLTMLCLEYFGIDPEEKRDPSAPED